MPLNNGRGAGRARIRAEDQSQADLGVDRSQGVDRSRDEDRNLGADRRPSRAIHNRHPSRNLAGTHSRTNTSRDRAIQPDTSNIAGLRRNIERLRYRRDSWSKRFDSRPARQVRP